MKKSRKTRRQASQRSLLNIQSSNSLMQTTQRYNLDKTTYKAPNTAWASTRRRVFSGMCSKGNLSSHYVPAFHYFSFCLENSKLLIIWLTRLN